MKPSRALQVTQVTAVGLLAAVMITGCSSKTSQVGASSQVTTGAGTGAGAASAVADDGGDNLGATMPKDFPAEVPLPQAALANATTLNALGKRSWTLSYDVEGVAQDVFHGEVQAMRDKGFQVTVIADAPDDGGALFTKGPFTIALTSGTTQLQLTVNRAAA